MVDSSGATSGAKLQSVVVQLGPGPTSKLCSPYAVKGLLLGQLISVFVTGTGIFSQYLSERNIHIPTTQSTLNYILLMGYLVYRWYKYGFKLEISWWRYALLAICDVEANYFVVKAYQYTSITSVMLIDCFTIPCVMILSAIFLKAKYRPQHMIGVVMCLVGLGALVASDALYGNNHTSGDLPHAVVGDLLCMVGSVFYAISNVGQEAIVKQHPRSEYLGMIGGFGFVISVIQLMVLEREELAGIPLNSFVVWGLVAGFAICLFTMYSFTSLFLQVRDSALFNLSLLTSDILALIAGVLLFGQHIGLLYFGAYVVIIAGLVVYNGQAVLSSVSRDNPEAASIAGDKAGFARLDEKQDELLLDGTA